SAISLLQRVLSPAGRDCSPSDLSSSSKSCKCSTTSVCFRCWVRSCHKRFRSLNRCTGRARPEPRFEGECLIHVGRPVSFIMHVVAIRFTSIPYEWRAAACCWIAYVLCESLHDVAG